MKDERLGKQPPKVRILVLDDEAGIRMMLSRHLSARGYTVETAEDASRAWNMLSNQRYDAFIFDLRLPGSGIEALYQQMRNMDITLADRVIFITGDLIGLGNKDFLSRAGNPVVEKPFDLSVLDEQLRPLLDRL